MFAAMTGSDIALSADALNRMTGKKVVVRIDSPGGMVQASDLIREQLDLTRMQRQHRIVEAAQHDWLQAGALQERLGWALVQVVQTQMTAAAGRAVQQEQLASLIVAASKASFPSAVASR